MKYGPGDCRYCGLVSAFLTPVNIPSVAPNCAAQAEQVASAQVEKDFAKIYTEII